MLPNATDLAITHNPARLAFPALTVMLLFTSSLFLKLSEIHVTHVRASALASKLPHRRLRGLLDYLDGE